MKPKIKRNCEWGHADRPRHGEQVSELPASDCPEKRIDTERQLLSSQIRMIEEEKRARW